MRTQECRLKLDWVVDNCENELDAESIREVRRAAEFCDDHPDLSGFSTKALRPLIREKDAEIKQIAIKKISEDAIGKQHAGRGHKKQITEKDVVQILAKTRKEVKPAPPLPKKTFDIIYADPPWEYDFSVSDSRAIESHYPTMSLNEICELKIPTVENAVLFLWTPQPKLREGLKVIDEWGFEYKTGMVWVKDKIGMGYYVRGKHELLLIATKGNPEQPLPENRPGSVIEAPRTKHSEKPKIIYDTIEKMYPNKRYLELFARSHREGWVAWGLEV